MVQLCAYCKREESSWNTIINFKCEKCKSHVHFECIKSKQPFPLLGDAFYKFTCQSCGEDEQEVFQRVPLSWRNAVMLALYNLHKTGQGKCGFFHWKAHICAFIDANWQSLFGYDRKKTGLWMGTVAGTLSAGCPDFFESGMAVVEQGYWRLVSVTPPLMSFEKKHPKPPQKRKSELFLEDLPQTNRSRRRGKASTLTAAIELKEKRETFTKIGKQKSKISKKMSQLKEDEQKYHDIDCEHLEAVGSLSSSVMCPQEGGQMKETQSSSIIDQQDTVATGLSNTSLTSLVSNTVNIKTEPEEAVQLPKLTYESLGLSLGDGDDSDGDLELDVDIETVAVSTDQMLDIHSFPPEIENLLHPEDIKWEQMSIPEIEVIPSDAESEGQSEKDIKEDEEKIENETDGENVNGNETESTEDGDEDEGSNDFNSIEDDRKEGSQCDGGDGVHKKKSGRPRKRRRIDDPPPAASPEKLQRISVFEENELLKKLNSLAETSTLTPELAILRRKLICNKTNREYSQPVFDLDAQVKKAVMNAKTDERAETGSDFVPLLPKLPKKMTQSKETRDLDRFMMKVSRTKKETRTYTSFRQRLVGFEDSELKPTISPYTTRVLMPFIWRNANMSRLPLKMRLLQEIQAYPHRKDPSWSPPPPPSIDYCYVRPEHIASVNALSREFFWPGIDMSECLQYPDFSCIVLYRKIVIGFAFMVPDRGYNEAYISFIFTHPEWRGVGIASFMLYHLIQTCMGKDVLLHVSASNPAMLLYQKFGFKAEELSLNFYHKYFPSNCTDSRHAFLMRLSR